MQQGTTFTHKQSRAEMVRLFVKTYNDVKLSHFCIKKDVINLSESNFAKSSDKRSNNRKTVSSFAWARETRCKMRPRRTRDGTLQSLINMYLNDKREEQEERFIIIG